MQRLTWRMLYSQSFSRQVTRRQGVHTSTTTTPPEASTSKAEEGNSTEHVKSTKTQAELDEEVRQKLAAIAGDGGEAGVEYEDGKPVAMKRSVRDNMFRYI